MALTEEFANVAVLSSYDTEATMERQAWDTFTMSTLSDFEN